MNTPFDLTGQQVGRYQLLSPLGAGGMGVVYDAIDPSLDRHVALKVLRPELVADPTRVQRFIREARSASALSHPNVVTVHEIGAEEVQGTTIHYIAMEKVDGKTLRSAIASGALALRSGLDLIVQVCEALAAAHAAGIVHRDLKPENVMVSSHGYAKVLDFGLAKLRDDEARVPTESSPTDLKSTSTGVVLGTAGYMSPEQARGLPADHRADIFALGCILYELVTGQRAFRGETIVDTLHKIIHEEPEPVASLAKDLPLAVQRIVSRAIAKEPDHRYQSAKDLALDLHELIDETGWKERSRETRPSAAAGVRRSTVLVVSALVTLIGLAMVWMLRSRVATTPAVTPASIRIERITNSGDVINAAISPDGKYVAFVAYPPGGQSLRLRQLASGRELELVPAKDVGLRGGTGGFWGVTFTPDSTAVVYGRKGSDDPPGTFLRIPVIGGPAEPIATDLYSRVTFSPDGAQMAWTRSAYPEPGQSALVVARSDGSDIRALAVRREPERFSPIYFSAPSWSPDGKIIAAVVANERDGTAAVLGIDSAEGNARPVTTRTWAFASAVEWMPDMSGVFVVATDSDHAPTQLWFVSWPSGDVHRVTNDTLRYRTASISSDGRNLVTVAADQATRVWLMPLDGSKPPERISDGAIDGFYGVSYLPDGRLLFSSHNRHLVRSRADGTEREEARSFFDKDAAAFEAFSGAIYVLTYSGEIATVNFDRTGRRVIVADASVSGFSVSPDGRWLAYTSRAGGFLHKVPVAGGEPVRLGNWVGRAPAWSPSGDRIAFNQRPNESASRLVVIDATSLEVVWSHDIGMRGRLRWLRDGSGLIVNDSNASGNLWLVSPDGTRKPLVTTAATEDIYTFEVSPDGSSVAFMRGISRRDAYLITGFR